MASRAAHESERGSIPLAMLAMIIAAGIVTGLGTIMVTQTRHVSFDQDRQKALQIADLGIQDATFRANNLGEMSTCTDVTPCSGSAAGGAAYKWTATASYSGAIVTGWTVDSTGTIGGAKRTVRVELKKALRFPLAAFGDSGVELKGSNGADSYNSASGATLTGNGRIGSNSNVNFNGASTNVDAVVLYNNTSSGNECTVNGASSACDNVTKIGPKLDLSSSANMQFIDQQIAACEAAGPLGTWKASARGANLIGTGAPQCFDSVIFDVNTTVTGTAILFVKKSVSFETGVRVNCQSCPTTLPSASKLQIFSAGTADPNDASNDTQNVAIGNQSYIGAAIYAPRAACLGNPSAAQADVYGALICGSVGRITSGNQGGWAFHYDDALANIGTGGYHTTRWDDLG